MPSQPTAILYTRPDCTYSDAMKHELDRKKVAYEHIDLEDHPERLSDLEKATGGEHITPVFVEGDTITIGFRGAG